MIKDNTRTVAYDSFENELTVGDRVVCAIPRYTYGSSTFILCKGIVKGWTEKRIKVEISEVENNTDIEFIEDWASTKLGTIQTIKPDKIYKLGD